jgi:hypothetical protein
MTIILSTAAICIEKTDKLEQTTLGHITTDVDYISAPFWFTQKARNFT